jgi:rod shape determining protein RodA
MVALNRRYILDLDWKLVGLMLALAAFGVIEISSAEPTPGMWKKQLVMFGVGVVVMFATTLVDYRKIINAAPVFYAVGLVLLALVLTIGKKVNGNTSWLGFGSFGGQPSELAKIFTILLLALFLGKTHKRPLDLRSTITAGLLWVVPTLLVYLENDTGTTLSYIAFLAVLLFLAGLRWSWIAGAAGVLVIGVIIAIPHVKASNSYKAERIKVIFWPEQATKQYRYQSEQSEIAVGSGGIIGKGFHKGTQGSLGFIPEVYTDFIFAVPSEETGFVGSTLALTLYLLIITRLIQIARQARDRAGMLMVAGYAGLLLYHVAISVGMVVRLLPIIGIPLPLMSFGGSSVLATCFALGLALNVRLRRFVN